MDSETDRYEDWYRLLGGDLEANEIRELVSGGLAKLDEFLAGDPLAEERLGRLLQWRLGAEANEETWQTLHSSLGQYIGEDLAILIYWVVGIESDEENRLEEVADIASPRAFSFLQSIVGIYGYDLTRVYDLLMYGPENWKAARRDFITDPDSGEVQISVRIRKFSGEVVEFKGPPDSILGLATTLTHTAAMVAEAAQPMFAPERVGAFIEVCSNLLKGVGAVEEFQAHLERGSDSPGDSM